MLDILGRQVASPVQFVKGLQTLYDAGARVFVEVGPKKALQGFADDVLGADPDVFSLFTNHPKFGDIPSFNTALCGLYAAGLGYQAGASAGIRATTSERGRTGAQARQRWPRKRHQHWPRRHSKVQHRGPCRRHCQPRRKAPRLRPRARRSFRHPWGQPCPLTLTPRLATWSRICIDRGRHILGGTAQSPAPGQSARPPGPVARHRP